MLKKLLTESTFEHFCFNLMSPFKWFVRHSIKQDHLKEHQSPTIPIISYISIKRLTRYLIDPKKQQRQLLLFLILIKQNCRFYTI